MHRLQIEPELGAGAEETREPKGGVCRHRPLALDDGADAGRRNTQRKRERIGGETKRLEKFLAQKLPRGERSRGGE